jgi:hypothetical protein
MEPTASSQRGLRGLEGRRGATDDGSSMGRRQRRWAGGDTFSYKILLVKLSICSFST